MKFAKLLRLDFLPRSTDLALLLLRLWLGLSMAILHGWGKLTGFSQYSEKFMDLLGMGQKASLSLAIFGELVCGILLAIGLFSRFAALSLVITMAVAFFVAHGGQLKGPGNGEMAFLYMGGYLALLLAGPGRFSLDAKMGGKV